MDKLNWEIRTFEELTLKEFHDLIQLRIEVFVLEQDCPYQELDGLDLDAWHVTGTDAAGAIVACSRILPPGVAYEYASMGRVIIKEKYRGKNLGFELMKVNMNFLAQKFPKHAVKISAQEYLIKFYSSLGFEVVGEGYLEDGIPHIGMILLGK